MAITILTQASAGAPALTGLAGSLVAVLDYCLVTTLGWTKPFSGTNLATYRQPAGSNGMYLRVDDSTSNVAAVVAYESMTDVSTGSGRMPASGTLYLRKTNAASSTARPWYFISNGKLFYLVTSDDGTAATNAWTTSCEAMAFGDVLSYKPGDTFNTALIADTTAGNNDLGNMAGGYATGSAGNYIARPHTQIGSAIVVSKYTDYAGSAASSQLGRGTLAFPSAIDGGIHLGRVFLGEAAGRRAMVPGLWSMMHSVGAIPTMTTFTGAGDLAGRSFVYIVLSTNHAMTFETSDTWGT